MLLDTPNAEMGWTAPPFALPDAEGNIYELSDLQGDNGLLIGFICNHCPYVKEIITRLVSDAQLLLSEGVNVVVINSNDYTLYPEDSPAMMNKFASQHGFTFPYLVDESQSVAKAYDAVCTPDFFGFNNIGELQYRGRLDDGKMFDSGSIQKELLEAMRLIARTGKGPSVQYPSMGCSIKWK